MIGGHRPGQGSTIIGNRPDRGPRDGFDRGRPNDRNPNWQNNFYRGNYSQNRWNHAGWGWNGGRAGYYPHYHVNPHYSWYNGSWGGYGRNNWYRPFFWGTLTGWGLSSMANSWGYGYGAYGAYYNPYYAGIGPAYASVYNYTQPLTVYNYVVPDDNYTYIDGTQPPPATDPGIQAFDQGLAVFKAGDYQQSLTFFDTAIQQQPKDPVIHEVRALALFAVGAYTPAAAALNSLLSTAPGMDWTTMSSLYGDVNDYTVQLRQLEAYCNEHPADAAAYFVLGYHYMVTGANNEAASVLKVVVQNQPKDLVAKQLLDTLVPPEPAISPTVVNPSETPVPAASDAETDLVGEWQATAGETTIHLTVTPDSNFTWSVKQKNQPDIQVTGQLQTDSDGIVMSSKEQGDMEGSVTSQGPDQWQFKLYGAPESDPGLNFKRVTPK